MPYEVTAFLACLVLSAFFSGSETALLSSNRLKLASLAESGDTRAGAILALVRDPGSLLAGILVGNNLVNVLATGIATTYCTQRFGAGWGLGIATAVTTTMLVIFSEFLPKALAALHPVRWSRRAVSPIKAALVMLLPLTRPLEWIARPMHALIPSQGDLLGLADVRIAVAEGVKSGAVDSTMERVLRGGLSFGGKTASDVLVPRVDVSSVEADADYSACLATFRADQYSRLLVVGDSIDEDLGYLAAKDFLMLEEARRSGWTAGENMRKALRVPGGMPLPELLRRMRSGGVHFAVVKDEYGGTAGIATLEDLLEELVGEIRDEHDADEIPPVRAARSGVWIVRGDLSTREVEERLGFTLDEGDWKTIGGMVPAILGRVPEVGDELEQPGCRLKVTKMDDQRVVELRVIRENRPEPGAEN
ncbi:MAG: hemolysin family protein [Planctomycetota bacterium]|jgi:CBS domain containing-hemolysin-like protein